LDCRFIPKDKKLFLKIKYTHAPLLLLKAIQKKRKNSIKGEGAGGWGYKKNEREDCLQITTYQWTGGGRKKISFSNSLKPLALKNDLKSICKKILLLCNTNAENKASLPQGYFIFLLMT